MPSAVGASMAAELASAELASLTGLSLSAAALLLEAAGGNLGHAAAIHFDAEPTGGASGSSGESDEAPSATPALRGFAGVLAVDDDEEDIFGGGEWDAPPEPSSTVSAPLLPLSAGPLPRSGRSGPKRAGKASRRAAQAVAVGFDPGALDPLLLFEAADAELLGTQGGLFAAGGGGGAGCAACAAGAGAGGGGGAGVGGASGRRRQRQAASTRALLHLDSEEEDDQVSRGYGVQKLGSRAQRAADKAEAKAAARVKRRGGGDASVSVAAAAVAAASRESGRETRGEWGDDAGEESRPFSDAGVRSARAPLTKLSRGSARIPAPSPGASARVPVPSAGGGTENRRERRSRLRCGGGAESGAEFHDAGEVGRIAKRWR